MKWLVPPLPQDPDERSFVKGDRVRAHYGFFFGCPPGPNGIKKGAEGTVTGEAVVRDDRPFEPKRMIPVRWNSGEVGEVVDSLLEKRDA